jgi:acyl-CoA synthetase (AMP-forming)/AMP-acid ligase II
MKKDPVVSLFDGINMYSLLSLGLIENYTYQDLTESVKNLRKFLIKNSKHKVLIVGESTFEWIVSLLSCILAGCEIYLISKKAKIEDIINLSETNDIDIIISIGLFIDSTETRDAESLIKNLNCHNTIEEDVETRITKKIIYLENTDNGVFSNIEIDINEIVFISNYIVTRSDFKVEKTANYISSLEFAENLVLGLFVPLLNGCYIEKPILASISTNTHNKCKRVILSVEDFKLLLKSQFEFIRVGWENKMLSIPLLRWLIILTIRFRFKEIFGKHLKELLIVNGKPNPFVEDVLKRAKIPVTYAFGILETGGIVTYSSHNERDKRSYGKIIIPYEFIKRRTTKVKKDTSKIRRILKKVIGSEKNFQLIIDEEEKLQLIGNSGQIITNIYVQFTENDHLIYLCKENEVYKYLSKDGNKDLTLFLPVIEEIVNSVPIIDESIALVRKHGMNFHIDIFVKSNPRITDLLNMNDVSFKKYTNIIKDKINSEFGQNQNIVGNIIHFPRPLIRLLNNNINRTLYEQACKNI